MSNRRCIGSLLCVETDLSKRYGIKINKNKNLKCPKCGNKILYWKEFNTTFIYELNKANTKIKNNPISDSDSSLSMPEGFKCSNCGWWCNEMEIDANGNIVDYE